MLGRLEAKTSLKCNAHTFRRTFATILAKRGSRQPPHHEAGEMGVYEHGREIYKVSAF